MAAAKHAGHPGDYAVTNCVKVLFDVGFARGTGNLVLHLLYEHWDQGYAAWQTAVLTRVQRFLFERVMDDITPLDAEEKVEIGFVEVNHF
jgi:hypothetical protein